jgi:serine/threonine protein kinase
LIDFGFAHQVEDETEYGDFGGTMSYFAPELAATHMGIPCKGKVLKAADVWAMGVIAYAMLTRKLPFSGHSRVQLFLSIVRDPVSFPTDVELSDSFKDFVDLLLTKNALRRPTVDEALNHPWITGDTSGDLNCKENEDDEDGDKTDIEGEHEDAVPQNLSLNAEPGEQVEGVLGSDEAVLESKSTDTVKASSTNLSLRNASLQHVDGAHQTLGGSKRCCSEFVAMLRNLRRSDSNESYDSASLTPEFASDVLNEENKCPNWRALAQSCNCLRRNMST